MSRLEFTAADRDERGRLLPKPPVERRLSDLLSTSKEEEAQPRRSIGRVELAGIVCGLVLTVALFVLFGRTVPAQDAPQPTARPTVAQAAPLTVYDQIQTSVPPSATPELPTATPEPPTQTPAVVYVEVAPPCDPSNPPYQAQVEVYDGARPLGTVRGTSCGSQADAQANADALAAAMKEGK